MKKLILSLTLAAAAVLPGAAQDFFDTSDPERFIDFGARVGFNTSNRTVSNSIASLWNHNSWGNGFDVGVIADINFKNFISVQPGFFFETRSGAFAYSSLVYDNAGLLDGTTTYLGKGREYLFTIPIVGSVHFNVQENLRWNVEFGPYFQFKLKSTFDHSFEYPWSHTNGIVYLNNVKTAKADVGLKMGMSLDIFKHYNVGFHYLAGLCHPWSPGELGGLNKEWLFTIGYNF